MDIMNSLHHRISRTVVGILAVLGLVLALLATPVAAAPTPGSAQPQAPSFAAQNGVDRQVLECYDLENWDLECTEAQLRQLIADAGTTPTRIVLGNGDVALNSTLVIPAGADIELVNHPEQGWGATDSNIIREDGFQGVMIRVEAGAKLTFDTHADGGMLTVNGRGDYVGGATHLIDVFGELTMNDGVVTGMRNSTQSYRGAITVLGEQAKFTLNGGEVTDNRRRTTNNSAQYGAGNIALSNGATMIMNGGKVTHGIARDNVAHNYGDTGGIGVFNGAHLEVNGGEISNNRGWAGGINVWNWEWDTDKLAANSEALRATVVINGGLIDSNRAIFGGGGVSIFGNAEVVMNGGTISNNQAPYGGGVNAMDLYVWGSTYNWGEYPGDGMKAGYTTQGWSEISPGGFTMNGGTITGNYAWNTGGGVNIVSNAVYLLGGDISNNSSDDQGGGVYVSSKSYTAQFANVVVENNSATHIGGGVWICPTGDLEIYVSEGGAIFNNTAQNFGDDIAHDNYGSAGAYTSYFAQSMLGAGVVAYYKDGNASGTDARFDPDNPGPEQVIQDVPVADQDPDKEYFTSFMNRGFYQVSTDPARDTARSFAQLRITDNTSRRGGGIGANGGITIGYDRAETELTVAKSWLDVNGNELTEGIPAEITVQVIGTAQPAGQDPATFNIAEPVTLNADNSWQHTFVDLPTTYHGATINYSIEEVPVDGYVSSAEITSEQYTDPAGDHTYWVYNVVLTNQEEATSLVVDKVWLDAEGMPLTEGLPESIELQLVRVDGQVQTPVGDPVTVTPDVDGNWNYTFTNLPKWDGDTAIMYSVVETEISGYTSTVSEPEPGDAGAQVTVTNTQVPDEPPTVLSERPEDPPASHPKTGVNVGPIAAVAAVLLAAGAFLIRRRYA
ncbi:MAG: Cna B-type domain-containing protein [Actinomycetaceae bacterium]|nr:Cna B-type domain-containing protein [Actinomycetaceae bacterium]